jgi:hypothetical protein
MTTHEAIKAMAEGASVWDDESPESVLTFRVHVQQTWFPLPSATQFVESAVKDAKRCSAVKKRSEVHQSILAILRSRQVDTCLQSAAEKRSQEKTKLKANRFMTAGCEGERKRKRRDGTVVDEAGGKKVRTQVSGSRRNREALLQTKEFVLSMSQQNTGTDERDKVKELLTTASEQYKPVRMDHQLRDFMEQRMEPRDANVVQQRKGMKVTPIMRGELNYFKTQRKQFADLLRAELLYRAIPYGEKDGPQELVKKLKKHEEERRKQAGEEPNDKFFRPLHLLAVEWNVAV